MKLVQKLAGGDFRAIGHLNHIGHFAHHFYNLFAWFQFIIFLAVIPDLRIFTPVDITRILLVFTG